MTDLQKEQSAVARLERVRSQAQRYEEQAASIKAARVALVRLTDVDSVTATQLLEAMKTLAEIIQAR